MQESTWNIVYGILIVVAFLIILIVLYRPKPQASKLYMDPKNRFVTGLDHDGYMDPISENTFPFEMFIINLERSPDRYNYITNHVSELGLHNFSRWPGVDGSTADVKTMISEGVNPHIANNVKGAAGCTLSHIRLWRHIVKNKLAHSQWVLVLDDANFHPMFINLFWQYWNQVPKLPKCYIWVIVMRLGALCHNTIYVRLRITTLLFREQLYVLMHT